MASEWKPFTFYDTFNDTFDAAKKFQPFYFCPAKNFKPELKTIDVGLSPP
jgi:hypothetical protein